MDSIALDERRSGRDGSVIGDERPPEERDRSRVIHSSAFRRLQGKTQVLGITEGDFHRTRLTHTMEVAQIARGIVLQFAKNKEAPPISIMPSPALIETISFCHGLGHPPFGHSGEIALNYAMRNHGGFEGNGQSLRLIARIAKHTEGYGLDPTRRIVLGVLKYPASYSKVRNKTRLASVKYNEFPSRHWKPPKCYLDTECDIVKWALKPFAIEDRRRFQSVSQSTEPLDHHQTKYKFLDTSIMELADDIAYASHDLEDGISLGLITRESWNEAVRELRWDWLEKVDCSKDSLEKKLFGPERKLGVGRIVHGLIVAIRFRKTLVFKSDLLAWNAKIDGSARAFMEAMMSLVFKRIIDTQEVQTLEHRGRYLILRLFDAIMADPKRLLGASFRESLNEKEADTHRIVCD